MAYWSTAWNVLISSLIRGETFMRIDGSLSADICFLLEGFLRKGA